MKCDQPLDTDKKSRMWHSNIIRAGDAPPIDGRPCDRSIDFHIQRTQLNGEKTKMFGY